MRIIKREKCSLIPVAYNIFCEDIASLVEGGKGIKESITIERYLSGKEMHRILKYLKKENTNTEADKSIYVIDMVNIMSYENRLFSQLKDSSYDVAIVNMNPDVYSRVKEDVEGAYIIKPEGFFSNAQVEVQYAKRRNEIKDIYHREAVNIVKSITEIIDEKDLTNLRPLDSSGVYCNMYINVKKLFLMPEKYYFIIYQMICMIKKDDLEVDAFISASRNGANLANIIGWLMGKKVIHCTNLGPKFSLASPNMSDDIRKDKKYIYIFDFMCLGTEIKVLNALLSIKQAELVKGYGIGNYIHIDENTNQFNAMNRVRTLVDVQKETFGYQIAGTRDEIKKLLKEEGFIHESGIQRI